MRTLPLLILLALSFLPGTTAARSAHARASEMAVMPAVQSVHELPHEHARTAGRIVATIEVVRTASETTPRTSSATVPPARVVWGPATRGVVRGSSLERGCRDASRGEHVPYLPIAPPGAR